MGSYDPKDQKCKRFFTYLQNNLIKPSFFVCVCIDTVDNV